VTSTSSSTTTAGARRPQGGPPRLLATWLQTGRADLAAHLSVHGPVPLPRHVGPAWATGLVEDVGAAGLTGRGGAGFPTSRKLAAAIAGRRPLLAVNALEGEPASRKDVTLLVHAPHLVLDGAALVAAAVGAPQIAVCVADDCPEGTAAVETALAERSRTGVGGPPARLARPPGRYVSGEESALVAWLAGGPARPRFRPTKGVPLTIGRRTVLVHSAETLANVALIARHGPDWFRSAGVPEAPGTCLVTVSGAVAAPVVREVELGTPLSSIVEGAGAGAPFGAVLVGGYGGSWVRPGLLDTPYAPGPLAAVGGAVGAGVIGVLAPDACGVAETARIAAYMADESAGQCGPCVFGLRAVADDLVRLTRGEGDGKLVSRLRRRLQDVDGRGACRHPDGAARLVRSALEVFARDVEAHARHRPCAAWKRSPILPVPRPAADVVRGRR